MRVAVVYFPTSKGSKLPGISKGLAQGIERQGHTVDLIDGSKGHHPKLTIYQYVAIGSEQTRLFGGKVPQKVREFLASAGMTAGKRSCAYIAEHAVGTRRTLARLMGEMEKEGMFLRISHSFSSPQAAEETGARLRIE